MDSYQDVERILRAVIIERNKQFTENASHMASKYKKGLFISLITMDMQIYIKKIDHFITKYKS